MPAPADTKVSFEDGVPPSVDVLCIAATKRLASVLVIGMDEEGRPYHAGTTSDPAKIRHMVDRFTSSLEV